MDSGSAGFDMGTDGTGGLTELSGSVSHLLFALQQTKAEIMAEIRSRFETLNGEIAAKIESGSMRALEKMLEDRPESYSVRIREESRQSDRSGQTKPPVQLKFLKKLTESEMTVVPLMQWFLLATVVSFTTAQTKFRSWIQEEAHDRIGEHIIAISGASGFSFLFFAVLNTDSKDRYQSSIVKLWTFIIRSAIVSVLTHAKQNLLAEAALDTSNDNEGGNRDPVWLSAFGNKRKTSAIVKIFMDKAEYKAEIFTSDGSEEAEENVRKRRRLEKDEEQAVNRGVAVKQLRGNLMQLLTYGRTEVRAYLFEHLFFLVEKIDSFPSLQDAKEAGFDIVFRNTSPGEDAVGTSDVLAGSIWDIANAKVRTIKETRQKGSTMDDRAIFAENRQLLSRLQRDFPNLKVTLKYRRRVIPQAEGRGRVREPTSIMGNDILWPVEEQVSLHQIAIGCLIEAFKVRDADTVLSTGSLSLKVIHVLAIALRGLLRHCMRLPLSEIEEVALGNVTHKMVQKGEDRVTAMMSTNASAKKKRISDIRKEKLEMEWEQYVHEKEKMEEEERRRCVSMNVSERSAEEESDEENEDWMNKMGL